MKLLLNIVLFFIVLTVGQAQQYFGNPLRQVPHTSIPKFVTKQVDNQAAFTQEQTRRINEPDSPLEFAVSLKADVDLIQQMQWDVVASHSIGSYRILSKNAHSLNLHFDQIDLPEGTELMIYNPNTGYAVGPIGLDVASNQELWTPIVFGDECVIELMIPNTDFKSSKTRLVSVQHDFVGFASSLFRGSGSCHLDVVCGEEDGYGQVEAYRRQISAVGAYHIDGVAICSGVAINNTNQDCTPYFLTAHHCNVNPTNANSLVVYWNYENSTCRYPYSNASGQPGNGSLNQFTLGSTIKADWQDTDMTLLELNQQIDPSFNVYMAGWNRTSSMPSQTAIIHHPNLEEKRISFDFDPPLLEQSGRFLRVLDWDIGSTAIGSSGAPLFDQNGLIIGQLFGGEAACGNDKFDVFGWLHKSWLGDGSSQRQLKHWLDPANSGDLRLNGYNCGYELYYDHWQVEKCISAPLVSNLITVSCSDAIGGSATVSVVDDAGIDISLSQNVISADSPIQLQLNNFTELYAGVYEVKLKAVYQDVEMRLTIPVTLNDDVPEKPILISPSNQTLDNDLALSLVWQPANRAKTYEVVVAEDEQFTKTIGNYLGLIEPNAKVEILQPSTTYYWKVKAMNSCGGGDWSEVSSFRTGFEFCTTLYNLDDVLIPEQKSTIHYPIDCPYDVNVKKLQVENIRGKHSYISDLCFSLKHFAHEVRLWAKRCGSNDDFSLGFDDLSMVEPECPITTGRKYIPIDPLTTFDGTSAHGEWDIVITDQEDYDNGRVEQASISFCFDKAYANALVPESNVVFVCDNGDIELDVFTSINGAEFVLYDVQTPTGISVPFSINVAPPYKNEQTHTLIISANDLADYNSFVLSAGFGEQILYQNVQIDRSQSSTSANSISNISTGYVHRANMPLRLHLANQPMPLTIVEVSNSSTFATTLVTVPAYTIDVDLTYNWSIGNTYYIRTKNYQPWSECPAYSDVMEFSVETGTNIIEENEQHKVHIYPNPANHQLRVESSQSMTQVLMYNLAGKQVDLRPMNVSTAEIFLDVSHYNAGVYLLRVVFSDGSQKVVRVVVQ